MVWPAKSNPVDKDDQPASVIERPGPELGQTLGGGGHEPPRDARLGSPRGELLDLFTHRLEPALIAPGRETGQHRGDHVAGEQIYRREGVIGLQVHLGVLDAAHPRTAHPHLPAAQDDLAVLTPVAITGPALVVTTLGAGHLGDLGFHELTHHVQADRHRRGQQALAHPSREALQLLAHLPRQTLR